MTTLPAKKPMILIVDDERHTREGLSRALRRDYRIALAENGNRALEWLADNHADVILSDLRMPGMDGMTLLSRLLDRNPKPIFILLTAYGSIETAVEAMRRGAYDFLAKPIDLDRLDNLLHRALAEHAPPAKTPPLHASPLPDFIGQSPAMQAVFETLRRVAPTKSTVLLQGESGTGKELAARALHALSPRATGPFVPVHCAALTPNLLESELFGHEKGAFTGATERRTGRFEMADGGTLFLDEIGEISPELQVKILRVLEERAFERVGGSHTLQVNVRLIAATNQNLPELVAAGKFREDLFYRLYVIHLTLPPLRERTGDIPLLAAHYLQQFSAENNLPLRSLAADALAALEAWPWPGNIRELRNVLERLVVLSRAPVITLAELPDAFHHPAQPAPPGKPRNELSLRTQQAEKDSISAALREANGNRTRAAQTLGISRRTLLRKIQALQIHIPSSGGKTSL